MSEKDRNVIHNLFAEFHYADDWSVIKSKLAEYVASVRKEERETAFKDAVVALRTHQQAVRDRHYGVLTLAIEAVEAAASAKGERMTNGAV